MLLPPLADHISEYVAAVGALGVASHGLVNAMKGWGFIGGAGFRHINCVLRKFFPEEQGAKHLKKRFKGAFLCVDTEGQSVRHALQDNWTSDASLANQKAIAKSLIMMHFTKDNAAQFAKAIQQTANPSSQDNLGKEVLTPIAEKMAAGTTLDDKEKYALSRLDFMLTALLDGAYNRADRSYQHAAKCCSMVASVILALFGSYAVAESSYSFHDFLVAFFVGIIATPIAPIANDLASALQAGVNALKPFRS